VKTKDLFAGCFVTIAPHDDVWLVSLLTDDQKSVSMRTYRELPDALEAVHEWMLMLADETEITPDPVLENAALQEALARAALGEEASSPMTADEVHMHDELRAWFGRIAFTYRAASGPGSPLSPGDRSRRYSEAASRRGR
jgi:hypothetical protein